MLSATEIKEWIMGEVERLFPPVIHILKSGYPMCGFSLALPGDWPPGNTWVSFLDPDAAQESTCNDCKHELAACKPS
jgi:hypothetical protein